MQTELLETFLEVARYGSVTRAAESLFLTQPSVSGRLRALEALLGEQLLIRSTRGVRLTDAGRELLPHAAQVVQAVRDGETALRDLRAVRSGTLVIGAAPAVSTYYLPGLLKQFTTIYPGVAISVRTGHSEEILGMLLADRVQIGLVRSLEHPEVEVQPCYEDELVLVVHPSHPFFERAAVTLAEVARAGLVLFDRTSSYYELTRGLFLGSGLSPTTVMELDNIEAAKKMVEEGLGVALLPRVAVAREIALDTLAAVTVADAPTVRRAIVAIHRRGAGPGGPARAFLQLVGDQSWRSSQSATLGQSSLLAARPTTIPT